MLRVLQEDKIQRVGGNRRINVDVRIIAATHQNLQEMMQEGLFRSDLWFSLHVFPIVTPPLRNRKEDIPALVKYFIEKKRKELNLPTPSKFFPDTLDTLLNYEWSGMTRPASSSQLRRTAEALP
jgi:hydrogenase-4 transcriptional activator